MRYLVSRTTDFSPLISEGAGQLSTVMLIFHLCLSNLRSSSHSHSSQIVPSIHAFFWCLVSTREISCMLEKSWLSKLTDHKNWCFLTKGVRCSHFRDLFLLSFPSEQHCPLKCKVLDDKILQSRPNSSAL